VIVRFHSTIPARVDLSSPSPYIHRYGRTTSSPPTHPQDFVLYPEFLSFEEQRALISLALWKLDRVDSRKKRRRRRKAGELEVGDAGAVASATPHEQLQSLFEAESEYGFEEVRKGTHAKIPSHCCQFISILYRLSTGPL
jgi:alkylated DNA repair protein alkB family protein 7